MITSPTHASALLDCRFEPSGFSFINLYISYTDPLSIQGYRYLHRGKRETPFEMPLFGSTYVTPKAYTARVSDFSTVTLWLLNLCVQRLKTEPKAPVLEELGT